MTQPNLAQANAPASEALMLAMHGAALLPGGAAALLPALHAVLAECPAETAGTRLHNRPGLTALLGADAIGSAAMDALGADARPVRAILFDKSPATNWALGWHQDRTIAVRARRAVPGFGPWTIKQGMQHVAPPFDLLERMVTLRVHLDPVPADNAPLLVAPGSHRLGRVAEADIEAAVTKCGVVTCLAEAGDIWIYATPILHASDRAQKPARRRVLQVDYSADTLPGGLEWLGV